ncbi:hypothetical protein H4696_008248 [Amycolatopsis lexingtonensis]|uniref:Uncharacterized protein n=1 Tax=Amycolatopsis lexingtonensis TaxID=218822 RepID=A0ABR9ID88_9PSEU|nr:hypothetical protein [Amycolatopsis lexingtonensis]
MTSFWTSPYRERKSSDPSTRRPMNGPPGGRPRRPDRVADPGVEPGDLRDPAGGDPVAPDGFAALEDVDRGDLAGREPLPDVHDVAAIHFEHGAGQRAAGVLFGLREQFDEAAPELVDAVAGERRPLEDRRRR